MVKSFKFLRIMFFELQQKLKSIKKLYLSLKYQISLFSKISPPKACEKNFALKYTY